MKNTLKNIFDNFLRFGLSGALLCWLYTKIDVPKTVAAIRSADLNYIFLAFFVFFIINFILILRWAVFLNALDIKVPLKTIFRYYLVGLFGNLFLPSAIGGDVIKILGLCRTSTQKSKVVASVVLDRLSGFAGIVIVAIGSLSLGYRSIPDNSILIAITVMTCFSLGLGTVLFNETAYSFCCQIFGKLPKIKDMIMRMHYDIVLIKDHPGAIFQAVALSVFSQLILAVAFFLTAKALHQEVVLFYFVIFIPLVCVISSLPSIGGLGVRETGLKVLFGKVGVTDGISVSIGLINFLFMVLVGLLGGLYYLMTRPKMEI